MTLIIISVPLNADKSGMQMYGLKEKNGKQRQEKMH